MYAEPFSAWRDPFGEDDLTNTASLEELGREEDWSRENQREGFWPLALRVMAVGIEEPLRCFEWSAGN